MYVYLDIYEDTSHPELQVDHEPSVEEVRNRVRFLEREFDRRHVEAGRYQQIVAGLATANANLTDRLKELEAFAPEPASSRTQEKAAGGLSRDGEGVTSPVDRETQKGSDGARGLRYRRWFGG